jgi:glycine dehydrogenase
MGDITTSDFVGRHIGPSEAEREAMLRDVEATDLDALIDSAIPALIRQRAELALPRGLDEHEFLDLARRTAEKNDVFRSYIGLGYYGTRTPPVILRNILENPAWYTSYTPYQAEISQGRMEALLNFQTLIMDMTGFGLANASLLDEGTALAEAVAMAQNLTPHGQRSTILVDRGVFPQSVAVLRTRAEAMGLEVQVTALSESTSLDRAFAVVVQTPDAAGAVRDFASLARKANDQKVAVICATDLLSLCLIKPPAEWGADMAVGSSQRWGVPMGFGGPHAAFLATHESNKRLMPGRIIGVSKDALGQRALRLALQTREQHIRREKATSNICTAQVLLAVMASMYAVYHGPRGLERIARRVHGAARWLAAKAGRSGFKPQQADFFDTLVFETPLPARSAILDRSRQRRINLRWENGIVGVSLDETVTAMDLADLLFALTGETVPAPKESEWSGEEIYWPASLRRTTPFLSHPTFNAYHSETEMLRYMYRLQTSDLSLASGMIPLGSCTMKLNATSEMIPVTWRGFSDLHPFAPAEQTAGYRSMIQEMESWLCEITGFSGISLQPNAGSQGEYAGLLVIRKYHESRGEGHRRVILIPSSAHGTNPASAVMAGFEVVIVGCDSNGNVDLEDLRRKAALHAARLAGLMVTYPSTHGVFEEAITEICKTIHDLGGQVYMDGANMNAMVGLARPGDFGPDVCHLNLHKTFCIPHGGGGPGVGPIGVAEHLRPFLPTHPLQPDCGPATGISPVSSAPWGSPSILPISWGYMRMMGAEGLKLATQVAILNANYMASKLAPHFPILYRGQNNRVAHECIIDCRGFKDVDITVDDIAKRLVDFGFHAPTMSWPVAGTLMIEPTESEGKAEMDRFIEAMIQIRREIREIETGESDRTNNVLKNAPHTMNIFALGGWDRPYSPQKAFFPLEWVKQHKFWPTVGRVDNAFGDRNFFCSCPPIEN